VKSYEAICIFYPDLAEEKINSVVTKVEDKVRSLKGEIEKVDRWGIRKLQLSPRKTKKVSEGFYVAVYFKGESEVPNGVRSLLKVTEGILRFMIAVSKPKPLEGEGAAGGEEKVEIASSMLEEPKGK